ncbi:MAG: DUF2505 family protein [Candidatus Lernaella stagnicola]|nr:DUF2505 family protein [Candidatus Lernaella stagnicola]
MKLEVDDVIDFPLDEVYPAFRDHTEELANYLEAIERIEVQSRQVDGDHVHIVSIWTSKLKFPGPIEKFIPKGARQYTDTATWHSDKHTVEWNIDISVLRKAVSARGANSFEAHGENQTLMKIRGDIDIDPSKIPGVPTMLVKRVLPTIIKFIVQNVEKNMKQGNRSIERYLTSRRKEG